MSALRVLALSYLVPASVFALAAMLTAHQAGMHFFQSLVQQRVAQFLDRQDDSASITLALTPPGPNDARVLAHVTPPAMPQRTVSPKLAFAAPTPFVIAPDLPAPEEAKAAPPPASDAAPGERVQAALRLKQSLTPELLKNFGLFLYVSKASSGPLAQHLYVFRKTAQGDLDLAYDWAASTGREKSEVTPLGRHTVTDTPAGYYQLDPDRMYAHYHSHAWDQPMPHAMFFNWEHNGEQTGLAIHAASGSDIAKLGSRASAGCVHISPEHAQLLYDLIRADYRGQVPRFAYDASGENMSNRGELMRDASGRLKMADGYRVLIFIENFGGSNVVAALD